MIKRYNSDKRGGEEMIERSYKARKIPEKQVGGQQEKARNGDLSQSHRHEIFDPVRKTPYPIPRPTGKQIHIIRVDPYHKYAE